MEETRMNQDTQKREKIKLTFDKVADFDATAETMFTTTSELSAITNSIFAPIFDDYYGAKIDVQYNGYLFYPVVTLYFTMFDDNTYASNPDGIYAFKPKFLGKDNDGERIYNTIQRIGNQNSGIKKKIRLTEDCKDILEQFMMTSSANKGKVNWDDIFNAEGYENKTFIKVFKIDFNKLIRKIYGEFDHEQKACEYRGIPTRPVSSSQVYNAPANVNWIIQITRLHEGAEQRALEKHGYNMSPNGLSNVVVAKR